jgi:hypothetical protein
MVREQWGTSPPQAILDPQAAGAGQSLAWLYFPADPSIPGSLPGRLANSLARELEATNPALAGKLLDEFPSCVTDRTSAGFPVPDGVCKAVKTYFGPASGATPRFKTMCELLKKASDEAQTCPPPPPQGQPPAEVQRAQIVVQRPVQAFVQLMQTQCNRCHQFSAEEIMSRKDELVNAVSTKRMPKFPNQADSDAFEPIRRQIVDYWK